MADRIKPSSSKGEVSIDMHFNEEQQKALIECLKKTGKLTLKIEEIGEIQLPKDVLNLTVVED